MAGRTRDVRPSRPAAGKPSEPHSEHHDEKKAKPVDGHCLPDEDTHRAEGVENGVATERGQDAGGDGHQEGEAEAGRCELKGRRQCLGDEGEGGDLVLEREPEVAADSAGEESCVLHPQRIVEAQQGPQLPHVLFSRLERQEEPRRIPGQVEKSEHDHGDTEQNEEALQQATKDVDEHGHVRPRSKPWRYVSRSAPGSPGRFRARGDWGAKLRPPIFSRS